MPTYEIEMNGQKYQIDAPDDQAVQMAVKQLQSQSPAVPSNEEGGSNLNDYYSSGIYSGEYNPLGPIAKTIDAFATNAQAAPLFGWGDEVAGLLPGENNIKSNQEALAQSNPVASMAGTIAGSAMTAGGLARAGVLPSSLLPQGTSLATRVGVGAGEGFGLGALQGAGTGEGDNRVQNALINGAIGAVAGGALPAVAQGVSSAYETIANNLARNRAANAAGTTPEVASNLARILSADGSLGPQGQANMQAAGREAMLADAGPNARSVLDTAIQRGGPGGVLARGRIDERVARDSQALAGALDNALGAPEGVTAARTNIRQGSSAARSNAYDAAYNAPIDYSDPRGVALERLIRERVPGSAINEANRLMQLGGDRSRQILANVADDGSVTYQTLPDVRQIDYITRALNQAASTGEGQGALGGQTPLGRAYEGLAGDIRRNLRDLVPEYGQALDTAADPIRRSQAVELGSRLLSPSMRRDQLREAVDGYSAAERDALAQGVRSQIDDTIANVTRTVQDGNTDAREAYKAIRDLSSRANREKLTIALGEDRAQPLFDELDRVAQSFQLRGSVADNSRTFARQATNQMVEGMTAPGVFGNLGEGKPLNAGQRIIQAITGNTPEARIARQDEVYSQIADYLTRPSQQAIPAFQAMQNYQGQSLANQARASRIAELLLSARSGVYPSAAQLRGDTRR